ncbi:MAG: hypothetical protein Q9185_000432 [Variospora sp. 1 TL-2023]
MEKIDVNKVNPAIRSSPLLVKMLTEAKGDESDRRILDVFGEGVLSQGADPNISATGMNTASSGCKRIQSQILSEMAAIDNKRALTSMKSWATFVQLTASRQRSQPFASLKEYLPYRIINAGKMIWFGTVTFAIALTIPEEEMEECKQLVQPAFAAISLTNDLFSWEKERDVAKDGGQTHVINAIWVLIRELCISEDEAKVVYRAKIKESITKYLVTLRKTRTNHDLSPDLRTYIEAIQYSLSGNLV